eukprot:CAMPEP_0181435364 /NCGR_PEP_ID=MMETSP1110-20121109/20294_1 /TAXON_ID=174948 /ORGANISM="Symbiodinium sp., Strain CCMP421" /LENGTH=65 /DNA_ID=CAMNT_0023558895 /DNA_START=504 /DNA_END=697 /DNA_ORIENTATION=-
MRHCLDPATDHVTREKAGQDALRFTSAVLWFTSTASRKERRVCTRSSTCDAIEDGEPHGESILEP